MTKPWPTSLRSVASLHLDSKNPRLGRETTARAPREIIQYLFEHDKTVEVARSIATHGYFPNEPLLAVREDNQLIVVEGNRRLAALKALKEPGVLEGTFQRQLERLQRQIEDLEAIASVPVTIAPSRRATDRQLAVRHTTRPVLPWEKENRASFILDKLADGYADVQLQDQLGFSMADIQDARQIRAIADMARSLDLPDEVKAKLDNPRAKIFSTLERVFEFSVGRENLKVEPDANHGLRITTSKDEFQRAFGKLVTDVALGKQSSRSLNSNEDMAAYFKTWARDELPAKRRATFVPADLVKGTSVSSDPAAAAQDVPPKASKAVSKTVLPKDFKVLRGNDRLVDIRRELVRLKREDYPNAGAVLLRVFFELAVVDYLERTGDLPRIVKELEAREKRRLPFGKPTMRQLIAEIQRIAKAKLAQNDAKRVEKAIRYDESAPFSINELHGFVHATDLPSARDILQFWSRTEPLFRLMLEQDPKEADK